MADNESVFAVAIPQIERDEGLSLTAYPDPLTGGHPWTIGYGSTGDEIGPDTVWTQEQAEDALDQGVAWICGAMDQCAPWWRQLDAIRAAVLVNMAYQIGVEGLMRFPNMLGCLRASDWDGAANQLINSELYHQTPQRTQRLADQLRTGIIQ